MLSTKKNNKQTVLSEILLYLIKEYGEILNITPNLFPDDFSKKEKISSRSAYSWLWSPKKVTLRSLSRIALASYFSKALPDINPIWFTLETFNEFENKVKASEENLKSKQYPCFGVPQGAIKFEKIKSLGLDIVGVYILYRYSFTRKRNGKDKYIREVVYIYREKSDLKFKSFYKTGRGSDEYFSYFNGTALPIGQTIVLCGTEWGLYQRARTFFFTKDNSPIKPKKFLFGTLTGSNIHQNMPCSAKVILMRYPNEIRLKDIENFSKKACEFSGKIIDDFGKNRTTLIELISNKVDGNRHTTLSSPREKTDHIFTHEDIHQEWYYNIKNKW